MWSARSDLIWESWDEAWAQSRQLVASGRYAYVTNYVSSTPQVFDAGSVSVARSALVSHAKKSDCYR
ncbi:MAG TPA: hypothetical protein VLJ42_02355 [Solirubrobacteraceae bacterium]|nr:hypothetical protein [Solirubrobacteraceae bacterium]